MTTADALRDFLDRSGRTALVRVTRTRGSTPRETGAFMLVSADATHGTIGGGQLEYMAIDEARQLLRGKASANATIDVREVCATLDVPLGPEIGQCCGGRVEVAVRLVDPRLAEELAAEASAEDAGLPHFYIFGGGHVGKALAAATVLLPLHVVVVDTRAEELEGMAEGVETRLTPVPEEAVRGAPAGSAFAVLTHDHALDFLIVAEALKRTDAAYVGMIGSRTKRATFASWYMKNGGGSEAALARLVSPIGGEAVKDKRPAVIAALGAAEIMTALALHAAAAPRQPA